MEKKRFLSLKWPVVCFMCILMGGLTSMTDAAPVSVDGPDYEVSPITIDKKTTVLLRETENANIPF